MNPPAIRAELPTDHEACESLVRDAFWDLYRPGCVEHLILHNAREHDDFVAELDLVAVDGEHVVGCIMTTRADVVDAAGTSREVLFLGPLAVAPDRQRTGIGSALIRASLERAADLGFTGAFLFGSPDYYPKFGFLGADTWGVTTADGLNFDAFMGIELSPGALGPSGGRLRESPVFEVDPAQLEEFETRFPFREKHVTATQFPQ